eukprot:bmy_02321T0
MDETFQRLLKSLKFYPHASQELTQGWDAPSLNANQKNLCAQFTDNGQIIFPESEYQIFSYPNPPLRGFTAWDPVALVAPFWDDADFSNSRGTIFYQEYETLYDEYNLLVREVESWIKMLTNTQNYKARWTLKVTWVHAPAYPAWGTIGTSTYQAILSTDGSRSYALFLYQSGGMQWDVTRHPGNPVLMGFSSGDGYFKNSPLTFQPVWEKYRPDQFLDSNSGFWNGNPDDDFRMPNGSTLPPGSSEEMLFHYGMACESEPQGPQADGVGPG